MARIGGSRDLAERRGGKFAIAVAMSLALLTGCNEAALNPEPVIPEVGTAPAETTFRHLKNQVVVDVRIGGKGPYTFLVDTGVTPSVIDAELARLLELPSKEEDTGEASGVGKDRVQIYPVTITDLAIAGTVVDDLEAVAAPVKRMSEKLGEPLHGILGYSFLKRRVVRIDYAKQTLAFSESSVPFTEDFSTADLVIPLIFGEGDIMPVVDVGLGDKTVVASIDTGSSLGLEIFSDAVDRLGLSETAEGWEVGEVTGARGTAEIRSGSLPKVTIGPLTFLQVPANVGPRRGGDYRDANIGNRLWAGYVLVFDYVDKRVAFRRSKTR